MVKRHKMFKKTLTLFWSGFFGKLIGVVREVLFASFFGTTAIADAYRAVFTTTISFSHLFTSEALNAAFIPQFRLASENNDNSEWTLFNVVGFLLFFVSTTAACLLYFFADTWVSLFFPGFVGDHFILAVKMLKIMAWGVPLYISSALLVSIEVGSGQFHLATLRPLLQNTGVIIATIIAFEEGQPDWIAWGFTGTYLLFTLISMIWVIRRDILKKSWYLHWMQTATVFRKFWNTMKPMVIFSGLIQTNIMLERTVASLIGAGAVATIDYARIIPETIQFLVIVPLGLVSLSAMANMKDSEVNLRSDQMSGMALLLFVPLSGFIFLSAPDIIRLFYGRGAFSEASVFQTSQVLRGMSVGLWAVCIANIFIKIYNAKLRNSDVLRIGIWGICANTLFNIFVYNYLGIITIGLGFSLGGIIMVCLFIKNMERKDMTWMIAKICILGIGPFILGGFILNTLIYMPLLKISIQSIWVLIFWGSVFLMVSTSRDMLKLLFARLFR